MYSTPMNALYSVQNNQHGSQQQSNPPGLIPGGVGAMNRPPSANIPPLGTSMPPPPQGYAGQTMPGSGSQPLFPGGQPSQQQQLPSPVALNQSQQNQASMHIARLQSILNTIQQVQQQSQQVAAATAGNQFQGPQTNTQVPPPGTFQPPIAQQVPLQQQPNAPSLQQPLSGTNNTAMFRQPPRQQFSQPPPQQQQPPYVRQPAGQLQNRPVRTSLYSGGNSGNNQFSSTPYSAPTSSYGTSVGVSSFGSTIQTTGMTQSRTQNFVSTSTAHSIDGYDGRNQRGNQQYLDDEEDIAGVFSRKPVSIIKKEEPSYVKINLKYQDKSTASIGIGGQEEDWRFCEMCNIRFSEKKHYLVHCDGMLHLSKMQQQQPRSNKEKPMQEKLVTPSSIIYRRNEDQQTSSHKVFESVGKDGHNNYNLQPMEIYNTSQYPQSSNNLATSHLPNYMHQSIDSTGFSLQSDAEGKIPTKVSQHVPQHSYQTDSAFSSSTSQQGKPQPNLIQYPHLGGNYQARNKSADTLKRHQKPSWDCESEGKKGKLEVASEWKSIYGKCKWETGSTCSEDRTDVQYEIYPPHDYGSKLHTQVQPPIKIPAEYLNDEVNNKKSYSARHKRSSNSREREPRYREKKSLSRIAHGRDVRSRERQRRDQQKRPLLRRSSERDSKRRQRSPVSTKKFNDKDSAGEISSRNQRDRNSHSRSDRNKSKGANKSSKRTKESEKTVSENKSNKDNKTKNDASKNTDNKTSSKVVEKPKGKEGVKIERKETIVVIGRMPQLASKAKKKILGTETQQDQDVSIGTTPDEDREVMALLEPLFVYYKPDVIRASVLNPKNRQGKFDKALLIQRCIDDLRSIPTAFSGPIGVEKSKSSQNTVPVKNQASSTVKKNIQNPVPVNNQARASSHIPTSSRNLPSDDLPIPAKPSSFTTPSGKKYEACHVASCTAVSEDLKRHVRSTHLPWYVYSGGLKRMPHLDDLLSKFSDWLGARDADHLLQLVTQNEWYPSISEVEANDIDDDDKKCVSNFHEWKTGYKMGYDIELIPPNCVAALTHWKVMCCLLSQLTIDQQCEFLNRNQQLNLKASAKAVVKASAKSDALSTSKSVKAPVLAMSLHKSNEVSNSETIAQKQNISPGARDINEKKMNISSVVNQTEMVDIERQSAVETDPREAHDESENDEFQETHAGSSTETKKGSYSVCPINHCRKRSKHVKQHVHYQHLSSYVYSGGPERWPKLENLLSTFSNLLGAKNLDHLLELCILNEWYPYFRGDIYQVAEEDDLMVSDFYEYLTGMTMIEDTEITPPNSVAALTHWRVICSLLNQLTFEQQQEIMSESKEQDNQETTVKDEIESDVDHDMKESKEPENQENSLKKEIKPDLDTRVQAKKHNFKNENVAEVKTNNEDQSCNGATRSESKSCKESLRKRHRFVKDDLPWYFFKEDPKRAVYINDLLLKICIWLDAKTLKHLLDLCARRSWFRRSPIRSRISSTETKLMTSFHTKCSGGPIKKIITLCPPNCIGALSHYKVVLVLLNSISTKHQQDALKLLCKYEKSDLSAPVKTGSSDILNEEKKTKLQEEVQCELTQIPKNISESSDTNQVLGQRSETLNEKMKNKLQDVIKCEVTQMPKDESESPDTNQELIHSPETLNEEAENKLQQVIKCEVMQIPKDVIDSSDTIQETVLAQDIKNSDKIEGQISCETRNGSLSLTIDERNYSNALEEPVAVKFHIDETENQRETQINVPQTKDDNENSTGTEKNAENQSDTKSDIKVEQSDQQVSSEINTTDEAAVKTELFGIDTYFDIESLKEIAGTYSLNDIDMKTSESSVSVTIAKSVTSLCNPKKLPGSSKRSLLRENENLYFAYGVHPKYAHKTSTKEVQAVVSLLESKRCVALGVVGCDYRGSGISHKEDQLSVLQFFFTKLSENKLPIIIECQANDHRSHASDDCLNLAKEFLKPNHPIIHHHFDGSITDMKNWMKAFPEAYFGISPILLSDKKHEELDSVVRKIPLEQMLLESCAPLVYTKRQNESEYSISNVIGDVAKRIALLKKTTVEQVLAATTESAKKVFNL